jgi:serine/threonine protein kinase
MIVYTAQGHPVELGASVGRGGEAVVYRVAGHPTRLAKIYDPAPRSGYLAKLGWMIAHPPVNPTDEQAHPSLAWPDALFCDSHGRLLGYSMPFIRRTASLLEVFNPRRRALVMPPYFDRRYLHRVARNLSAALNALHHSGYVAGDLNESNVLVTHSALVTLIDTDSFQVQEESNGGRVIHPCPVGKLEYTPAELQGKPLAEIVRLPAHDAFGLAVLIFQILMEGSHPFRSMWLAPGEPPPLEKKVALGAYPYTASPTSPVLPPKNGPDINALYPWLAELFRRCFLDGHRDPALRPLPETWERAIAEAERHLVVCPVGHVYSDHLGACPSCAAHRPGVVKPAQVRVSSSAVRPPAAPPNPARTGTQSAYSGAAAAAAQTVRTPGPVRSTVRSAPPGGQAAGAARRAQSQSGIPVGGVAQPVGGVAQGAATQRSSSASAQSVSQPQSPAPSWRSRVRASRGRHNPAANTWTFHPAASAAAGTSSSAGGVASSWGPGQSTSHAPVTFPFRRIHLGTWIRQQLAHSLSVGGANGALAGLLPGLLFGLFAGVSGAQPLAWGLLFAWGGAASGLALGWRPGYRMATIVNQRIGWQRFWQWFGTIAGGGTGLLLGLPFGWAIFPLILGVVLGGRVGRELGGQIWKAGHLVGWDRIWSGLAAASTAVFGWVIAGLIGASGVSELGPHFALALEYGGVRPLLTGILAAAFTSALGGMTAGIFSDLIAGLLGLSD